MLLEADGPEPAGKGGLGTEAGDHALGRVQDNIDRLAVGLTLHSLQRDIQIKMLTLQMEQLKTRPEDLDTELEDHVADEWRYMCMSRPVAPLRPVVQKICINDPLKK